MIFDISYGLLFLSKQKIMRWFHQLRRAACTNKNRRFQYYPTSKKITPLQQGNSVAKENTNLFHVAMGAYNGAEVYEIVGLLLLNNLAYKFNKNGVGWYRDIRINGQKYQWSLHR